MVGASNAVTHPWTCTPIASQVKANTSPARPKARGIRQPRNNAPITNDNSDVRERDGPKVTSDIVHYWHSAPSPASASADLPQAAEHDHDPVTGKLAHGALRALHHHRRAVDQRGP